MIEKQHRMAFIENIFQPVICEKTRPMRQGYWERTGHTSLMGWRAGRQWLTVFTVTACSVSSTLLNIMNTAYTSMCVELPEELQCSLPKIVSTNISTNTVLPNDALLKMKMDISLKLWGYFIPLFQSIGEVRGCVLVARNQFCLWRTYASSRLPNWRSTGHVPQLLERHLLQCAPTTFVCVNLSFPFSLK